MMNESTRYGSLKYGCSGTVLVAVKAKDVVVLGHDSRGSSNWHRITSDCCDKSHIIAPQMFGMIAGKEAGLNCLRACQEKYQSMLNDTGTSMTVCEVASWAQCYCDDSNVIPAAQFIFAGLSNSNQSPSIYALDFTADVTDSSAEDVSDGSTEDVSADASAQHMLNTVFHVSKYLSFGSGNVAANEFLSKHYEIGLSREKAINLVKKSILEATFTDAYCGGPVHVFVLDREEFGEVELTHPLNIFLDDYKSFQDYHQRTLYTFSVDDIFDSDLVSWFRDGLVLAPVKVHHIHVLMKSEGLIVRRVVFESALASDVIGQLERVCKGYGCKRDKHELPPSLQELSTLQESVPCFQVLSAVMYFMKMSEDDLVGLLKMI